VLDVECHRVERERRDKMNIIAGMERMLNSAGAVYPTPMTKRERMKLLLEDQFSVSLYEANINDDMADKEVIEKEKEYTQDLDLMDDDDLEFEYNSKVGDSRLI